LCLAHILSPNHNTRLPLHLPSFFLYSSLDHLHLHSFPTRRSSDLAPWLWLTRQRLIMSAPKTFFIEPRLLCIGDNSRDCLTRRRDRKSTRLNSSHSQISYAVFCLKKKKKNNN